MRNMLLTMQSFKDTADLHFSVPKCSLCGFIAGNAPKSFHWGNMTCDSCWKWHNDQRIMSEEGLSSLVSRVFEDDPTDKRNKSKMERHPVMAWLTGSCGRWWCRVVGEDAEVVYEVRARRLTYRVRPFERHAKCYCLTRKDWPDDRSIQDDNGDVHSLLETTIP